MIIGMSVVQDILAKQISLSCDEEHRKKKFKIYVNLTGREIKKRELEREKWQ